MVLSRMTVDLELKDETGTIGLTAFTTHKILGVEVAACLTWSAKVFTIVLQSPSSGPTRPGLHETYN